MFYTLKFVVGILAIAIIVLFTFAAFGFGAGMLCLASTVFGWNSEKILRLWRRHVLGQRSIPMTKL